jgi:hypothetical protein
MKIRAQQEAKDIQERDRERERDVKEELHGERRLKIDRQRR